MSIIIMKEWTTESSLKAIATFNDRGYYCGYVIVDPFPSMISVPSYPLPYGFEEEELTPQLKRVQSLIDDINVHGGITFANYLGHLGRHADYAIGFDCAHSNDAPDEVLAMEIFEVSINTSPYINSIRISIDYVIEQAESLAKQLASIHKLLLPII